MKGRAKRQPANKTKPAAFPVHEPRSKSQSQLGHADIVTELGIQILSGTRTPGSRLPSPEELFETFGVSRVVLREVTRTLAAKGMVTCKTRVGTLVSDPSLWNWLDAEVLEWRSRMGLDQAFLDHITEARLAMEPAAAALAARRRSRQDLARMRAAIDAMRAAETGHHGFSEADLALHAAVAAASGNPLFRSFISATEVALFKFLRMMSIGVIADENTYARATAQHARIVDAIEARDENGAFRAMTRVIKDGLKHVHAGSARG